MRDGLLSGHSPLPLLAGTHVLSDIAQRQSERKKELNEKTLLLRLLDFKSISTGTKPSI